MLRIIIIGIATAVIMGVEYLLCTKLKSALWGGIIPLVILSGTIAIFALKALPLESSNLFPFIVINCLMLSDWESGRKKYKESRKQEIEKMKVKDM